MTTTTEAYGSLENTALKLSILQVGSREKSVKELRQEIFKLAEASAEAKALMKKYGVEL